jgi:hypothetical protein
MKSMRIGKSMSIRVIKEEIEEEEQEKEEEEE